MKKEFYKRKDCIQQLMKLLRSWSTWCFQKKQKCKILRISKVDRISLLNQDDLRCCLCGEEMEESQRVIHHCHLTGEIFGVAHSKCNLRARTTNFLPVFFHNLSRYDAHHIIKHLVIETGEKLSAIAKNDESYIRYIFFDIRYLWICPWKNLKARRVTMSFSIILYGFWTASSLCLRAWIL